MMRFKDISIRSKVLLIICAALFFQLLIALTGLHYLNQTNRNLEAIVDKEAEAIKVGLRINSVFRELIISEKNMILSKSKDEINDYINTFDDDRRSMEERLSKIRDVISPVMAAKLNEFEVYYREYLSIHQRIRELIAKNENIEAVRLSEGPARDQRNKARDMLNRLVDESDAALDQRKIESQAAAHTSIILIIGFLLATLIITLGLGFLVIRAITTGLGDMVIATNAIADGNLETPINATSRDEVGKLASSIDKMQSALRVARDEAQDRDWLKTGLTKLNEVMRGELKLEILATKVISEISEYLDAKIGAFYVMGGPRDGLALSLLGTYAYTRRKNLSNHFKPGEGLVGQAALERKQILVSNVPNDYIKITSGLGETAPKHICVTPLVFENRVKGVIEAGTMSLLTDLQLEYLSTVAPAVAITLEAAQNRDQIARALEESQRLSGELQTQQEELKTTNEELESQTQRLKESEERLKTQQEELEVTNEELEEKNNLLERQKNEVEQARREIGEKAEELALSSKYKSQFLSNMSHELRTPLNSLLLLAQGLSLNKDGNLTAEQVESAKIIHNSGSDLLDLINEILDLSKIEAGRTELQIGSISVSDLADGVQSFFGHMAEEKGLLLKVTVNENSPVIPLKRFQK